MGDRDLPVFLRLKPKNKSPYAEKFIELDNIVHLKGICSSGLLRTRKRDMPPVFLSSVFASHYVGVFRVHLFKT